MDARTVLNTTYLSIIIQFVTGVIGALGLFVPLAPKDMILKSVLLKETIVQCIEFLVYLLIVIRFNLEKIAATRYLDWFFTTPIMLFTTMIYFKYTEYQEKKVDTTFMTTKQFIMDHHRVILLVLALNMGMLIFGYFGELGLINREVGGLIGYAFFFASFGVIYKEFVNSSIAYKMFTLLFIFWSLYCVAYLLPVIWKNICINFLDIVAKNFFGVFLFFVIYSKKIEKN